MLGDGESRLSDSATNTLRATTQRGMRYFEQPIDGPTNTFCDNNSVVQNVTRPESVLQKKHNSIAYHKVRESVASTAMRVLHEPGATNLADLLTKWLPPLKNMACCKCMHALVIFHLTMSANKNHHISMMHHRIMII